MYYPSSGNKTSIVRSAPQKEPPRITAIWLVREGGESDPDTASVLIEVDDVWYYAIRRERVTDGTFSHIIESAGLASCVCEENRVRWLDEAEKARIADDQE